MLYVHMRAPPVTKPHQSDQTSHERFPSRLMALFRPPSPFVGAMECGEDGISALHGLAPGQLAIQTLAQSGRLNGIILAQGIRSKVKVRNLGG